MIKMAEIEIREEIYREEFTKPITLVGNITVALAIVGMLLPPIWLYLQYGLFAGWPAVALGMALALTYAVPFFFIEPISYYPILGDAGTYMSFLAGNISNLRLPVGAVVQSVAGVKEGTRLGELIATIGIAVSIWMSIIAVFLGAVGIGWVIGTFPLWVRTAFAKYLLPAVFGSVFGLFTLRGPKYAPGALAISLVLLYFKVPAYIIIPIAVFGTMGIGKLIYDYERKKSTRKG